MKKSKHGRTGARKQKKEPTTQGQHKTKQQARKSAPAEKPAGTQAGSENSNISREAQTTGRKRDKQGTTAAQREIEKTSGRENEEKHKTRKKRARTQAHTIGQSSQAQARKTTRATGMTGEPPRRPRGNRQKRRRTRGQQNERREGTQRPKRRGAGKRRRKRKPDEAKDNGDRKKSKTAERAAAKT